MYLHQSEPAYSSDFGQAPGPACGIAPNVVDCGAVIILDGFDVGDYRMKPAHYTPLAGVIPGLRALGTGSGRVLSIDGHGDSTGAEVMNSGLSVNRASEVETYLRRQGVRVPAIVRGLGESCPIAPNTTEAGRRRNRRVEIRLCSPAPPPPRPPLVA